MWKQKKNTKEIKQSALKLAKVIVKTTNVLEIHKKKLLSELIWKITEAEGGKYNTRFISEGFKKGGRPIQHEHVVPRKTLINQILNNPIEIETILNSAIGCVVTKDEHLALTKLKSGESWARYKNAGIRVYDQLNKKWVKF